MGKIIVFSWLIFAEAYAAVRAGDILLQPLKCWSCTLIEQQENSDYSHIGIYLGDGMVAEAYAAGVKTIAFSEFMAKTEPGMSVRVRRLRNPPKGLDRKIKAGIKAYIGLPYDRYFLWTDQKIYCSELLYKLLVPIVRLDDLAPKPMLFDQNPEYWDRYFNGNTPRGELGISPEDFNLSSDFITVDELYYVPAQKN